MFKKIKKRGIGLAEIWTGTKEFVLKLPNPVMMILKIIIIFIIAILVVKIGSFIIKKAFARKKSLRSGIASRKMETIESLMNSIFRYTVYILAGIIILVDVLNLKSVLAAAGIGGIALGLGAQSLIKDVISGFFIAIEDQYVVGDMISVDTMTGNVERMELRVTRLRNFNGDLYIIPNGEIRKITNHTRGNKTVIVDIPLAYSTDISRAFEVANEICERVRQEFNTIVEAPTVLGITDMGKDSMNLRIIAKTFPNEQWEVERRIRRLVKEEFDKENLGFFDRNKIVAGENIQKEARVRDKGDNDGR